MCFTRIHPILKKHLRSKHGNNIDKVMNDVNFEDDNANMSIPNEDLQILSNAAAAREHDIAKKRRKINKPAQPIDQSHKTSSNIGL